MSIRSSGSSSAWALMTVSELTAGMKVTCRPRAANRPWCRATKKPAESTAGTTATFRFGCSMTGGSAFPPPVSLGKNRIAKTATAAPMPTISTTRMARVNLRIIAGCSLPVGAQGRLRPRRAPGPWLRVLPGLGTFAGCWAFAGVFGSRLPRRSREQPQAVQLAPGRTADPDDMAKHPLLVAGKIVLQIAVRDIGQLTDLWPTGYGFAAI